MLGGAGVIEGSGGGVVVVGGGGVMLSLSSHCQQCWWWGDTGVGWSSASGLLGLDSSSLDDAGGSGVVEGCCCRCRSTLMTTLVVG